MDCHSNHSVFLRANGSLACWDDAGSRLTLQAFDPNVDYSKDVVFGEVFAGIRSSLETGEMPFPKYCQDCLILASGACFNPQWQEKKELLIFQVEASIACTLECPGCMTFAERKSLHGRPWHLDIEIFEKYLSDFKSDGVTIRTIDFQGHGEPLLNRDVWKMARLAKAYFPDANISMCTASHGKYDISQVQSGIDEMMFAIDGVDQESFEPNRVRGDFDKAFTFMKSFCQGAIAANRQIKTVWKYILFDCNNSLEQLTRAQEMAAEAGVQELHFVNTQLGLKSSKVFSLDQIPRVDNGVKVSLSSYLSNFHDTLHGVDKARFAISQGDPVQARAQLLFPTNMIRRRWECIEPGDALPQDYQALVYEILELSQSPLIDEKTRKTIQGGFHALTDKLAIGRFEAKNLVIKWKSEEIRNLNSQFDQKPTSSAYGHVRVLVENIARFADETLGIQSFRIMNRILSWKSQEVRKLAILLDQKPAPGVSVM